MGQSTPGAVELVLQLLELADLHYFHQEMLYDAPSLCADDLVRIAPFNLGQIVANRLTPRYQLRLGNAQCFFLSH